jgi:hypothetical protein
MLIVIMLSVIMLNVTYKTFMLSVVMLNVVAPLALPPNISLGCKYLTKTSGIAYLNLLLEIKNSDMAIDSGAVGQQLTSDPMFPGLNPAVKSFIEQYPVACIINILQS